MPRGGRRKGAGRPRTIQNPVNRWIRLERTELDEAEALADRMGISFAELFRRALRAYLARHRAKGGS